MATIYILEDDLNIQEIEAYALKNSGYQTCLLYTSDAADDS